MTQKSFAERLGTIRETVAKWETGASEPSWDYVQKVVEVFPYAAMVDGAPEQLRATDLQRAAIRAFSREARDFPKSYESHMLPHVVEISATGVNEETGLPHGLDYFLAKYGDNITKREEQFLKNARFKFDGTLWMDEDEWWLFLKLICRGYYLGQAQETPADAVEERGREAVTRIRQNLRSKAVPPLSGHGGDAVVAGVTPVLCKLCGNTVVIPGQTFRLRCEKTRHFAIGRFDFRGDELVAMMSDDLGVDWQPYDARSYKWTTPQMLSEGWGEEKLGWDSGYRSPHGGERTN